MQPILSLENIEVAVGPAFRLEIDTLALEAGRLYCLTGPNGAGKTTLLRLLALLAPPTRGLLRFDGRTVVFRGGLADASLRREVTLVQQAPYLFQGSVYDNLAFGLSLRNIASAQRSARIEAALESVGLAGFAQRSSRALSGGEIQRVALARALVLQPRVLLLDEPLANIDVGHLALFENRLRDLCAEQGMTIVMSTHDPGQPERLGSKVISLNGGSLTNAWSCPQKRAM